MKIARTRSAMKKVVSQWKYAAPALAEFRQQELVEFDHAKNWRLIDALLEHPSGTPDNSKSNGSVVMQKWFMKLARQQGLLQSVVKEAGVEYTVKKPRKRKR